MNQDNFLKYLFDNNVICKQHYDILKWTGDYITKDLLTNIGILEKETACHHFREYVRSKK